MCHLGLSADQGRERACLHVNKLPSRRHARLEKVDVRAGKVSLRPFSASVGLLHNSSFTDEKYCIATYKRSWRSNGSIDSTIDGSTSLPVPANAMKCFAILGLLCSGS